MGCGEWNFIKCSWSHGNAHICKRKTFKIFFFGTKRPMALKLGIQHWVFEYYHCAYIMILGWTWPFVWHCQICFWMFLHGWKLIQHWVLMYFQVCSNSAYPQHSGERYRANGPLVYLTFVKLAGNNLDSVKSQGSSNSGQVWWSPLSTRNILSKIGPFI